MLFATAANTAELIRFSSSEKVASKEQLDDPFKMFTMMGASDQYERVSREADDKGRSSFEFKRSVCRLWIKDGSQKTGFSGRECDVK